MVDDDKDNKGDTTALSSSLSSRCWLVVVVAVLVDEDTKRECLSVTVGAGPEFSGPPVSGGGGEGGGDKDTPPSWDEDEDDDSDNNGGGGRGRTMGGDFVLVFGCSAQTCSCCSCGDGGSNNGSVGSGVVGRGEDGTTSRSGAGRSIPCQWGGTGLVVAMAVVLVVVIKGGDGGEGGGDGRTVSNGGEGGRVSGHGDGGGCSRWLVGGTKNCNSNSACASSRCKSRIPPSCATSSS